MLQRVSLSIYFLSICWELYRIISLKSNWWVKTYKHFKMWKMLLDCPPESCTYHSPVHRKWECPFAFPTLLPAVFSCLQLKPSLLSSVHWKVAHCFYIYVSYIYEWGIARFKILIGHLCFLCTLCLYFYFVI